MPALAWTLIIYLLLGIAYYGWGIAAARVFRIDHQPNFASIEPVWLGWAFGLLVLQLVHLAFALDAYVVAPFFVLGLVFAFRFMIPGIGRGTFHVSRRLAALGATVILVAAWIALRSVTQPPENYDSGLYHFSAIRWIFTYPIVLGLGNLHGRLAFNSSLLPLVAALDIHPFFDHGHSIANSLLLVLGVVSIADLLRPVVDRPSLLVTSHPFRYAAPLFALPPLGYVALSSDLASPTPDVASTILQIVVFVMICHSIGGWREGDRAQDYRAALILILAASAVTIKLSNLAFSAVTAGFVAAYWIRSSLRSIRTLSKIFLPASLVVLVSCFRGFLLSGAPVYPSTIGYIPVEWAVPREAVIEDAKWVYSWARNPRAHWSTVLGNWAWLQPWLRQKSKDFVGVVFPLALSGVSCILAVVVTMTRRRHAVHALEWAIFIPSVAGLVYWFFTAPDIRFAHALFSLLAISGCLVFLLSIQTVVGPKAFTIALCAVLFVGNIHILQYSVNNKWLLKPCAKTGSWIHCIPSTRWQPIKEIPLTTLVTSSGLEVLTPTTGDQCWDSPLPCTPIFKINLRQREPGALSSGFAVLPP